MGFRVFCLTLTENKRSCPEKGGCISIIFLALWASCFVCDFFCLLVRAVRGVFGLHPAFCHMNCLFQLAHPSSFVRSGPQIVISVVQKNGLKLLNLQCFSCCAFGQPCILVPSVAESCESMELFRRFSRFLTSRLIYAGASQVNLAAPAREGALCESRSPRLDPKPQARNPKPLPGGRMKEFNPKPKKKPLKSSRITLSMSAPELASWNAPSHLDNAAKDRSSLVLNHACKRDHAASANRKPSHHSSGSGVLSCFCCDSCRICRTGIN